MRIGNGRFSLDLSNIHLLYREIVSEKIYHPEMQKMSWVIVGVKNSREVLVSVDWREGPIIGDGDDDDDEWFATLLLLLLLLSFSGCGVSRVGF